jgi:hypothetical protein
VIITVSRVEDGVAIEVDPDPTNAGKYNCILEPGSDEEAYEISLKLTDGSNVKGHCIVKIGNGAEQHTAAIIGEGIANVENATITDPFTFRITVKERTNVTLEPRWGVVVQPDIEKGNVITVGAVQSGRETE